jgi:sulfatase maturation enzyme AslB (radical SAM superfamily)
MFKVKEVHYDITNMCNALCPQCVRTNNLTGKAHNYIKKMELSLDDFKKVSPPWFLKELEYIYFCGNYGDPLIAKDLLGILDYVWECNSKLSVKVHSNCSLKNGRWWKLFAQLTNDKKFTLVASVDGASQHTQELYRVNTNFDKIIDNLKTFIHYGGKVEWRFIVFKHNEHEIELAEQMSKDIGCINFKSYKSNRQFTKGKFPYMFKGKIEYLELPSIEANKKFDDRKIIEFNELENSIAKIDCISNKTKSIFIDFEGNIMPCCHYGIRLYTNRRNTKDVNGDDIVQKTINDFGNEKFNALNLGFETALANCGFFLDSLIPYWNSSNPLVCKMICGKK